MPAREVSGEIGRRQGNPASFQFHCTCRNLGSLRFMEIEQFHFEAERGSGWDIWWLARIAICKVGRTHDLRLLTFLHLLDGLSPAGDDAVQRELCGLVSLDRAI